MMMMLLIAIELNSIGTFLRKSLPTCDRSFLDYRLYTYINLGQVQFVNVQHSGVHVCFLILNF